MSDVAEQTFSAEISALGDKLAALTIVQAVELKDYLKTKYKIEPAVGGGGGGAAPVAAVEKPAEKTEFTVFLEGFDDTKKINVIKVVRELTGLGLKEAKDLVEAKGKAVKENLPKADADKIKKQLEDAGGKVSLK